MATGLPPNMTDADNEWALRFCNIKAAWTQTPNPGGKSKGEGIVVAHPDTGHTRHPELRKGGRLLIDDGKNFYDENRSTTEDPLLGMFPLDFPSHGTGTASVIMSAEGHPFTGQAPDPDFEEDYFMNVPGYPYKYSSAAFVTGVAPLAKVIPYRITNTVFLGEPESAALAKAIHHATGLRDRDPSPLDVGVISISLGRDGRGVERNIQTALFEARMRGTVVCGAAGQFLEYVASGFPPAFPGNDPSAISVGACDYMHGELTTGFYGEAIDITAPGVNIWRAWAESGGPTKFSVSQGTGTSHATAVVAGACALWQAHWGRKWLIDKYGAENILDLFRIALTCSADTLNDTWDTARRGAGVLDVEALLKLDLTKLSGDRFVRLLAADIKTPLREFSASFRSSAFYDESL